MSSSAIAAGTMLSGLLPTASAEANAKTGRIRLPPPIKE